MHLVRVWLRVSFEVVGQFSSGAIVLVPALLSGKIDQYEYLTDEEILPSDQSRIIESAKLTYSPLSKAFEK